MISVTWKDRTLEFPDHTVPREVEDLVLSTYSLRDDKGEPCETLEEMYSRVVTDICPTTELREAVHQLMRAGVFYPNVVFFMNAGTGVRNLAACYGLVIEDTMEDIEDTVKLVMEIQTKGGGTGINFSNLRPKGALVHSNGGRASGPVNIMRLFDSVTAAIKAGGRRRGANIGILRWNHPDIKEFVTCKSCPGEIENFNLSVLIDEEFMTRLRGGNEEVVELFNLIATQAWKTGDPGLVFYETLNRDNPRPDWGDIRIVNPCGEVALPAPFACNLGSIDVSKVDEPSSFATVVEIGASFLDVALDKECYVSAEILERVLEVRPVGLGIMGFADLLLKRGVRYGSPESLTIASDLGGRLRAVADMTLPDSGVKLAFAPTGTLGALANCSSGIEPVYRWKFTRRVHTTGKEIVVQHPLYPPGLKPEDTLPDYFVTAHEVSAEEHVKVTAAFQKHVDGGVSKTVNLSHESTEADVKAVFILAHVKGCKGITVYRDGCRQDQPLGGVEGHVRAERRKLPDPHTSLTHKFRIGESTGYVNAGMFEDGTLGEVFLTMARQGTTVRGLVDCFAIAISLCLQYGVPLQDLVRKFRHHRFDPSGSTSSPAIPFASSLVDYIFNWFDKEFGADIPKEEERELPYQSGETCLCGSQLIRESNCDRCPICGYSRCS